MMHKIQITPERLIGRMSLAEVQEFLGDLDLSDTARDAARFKNLVFQLDDLELAIETVGGPVLQQRKAA
ncbi:hypothetical protein K227x_40930 [Rubripirellula lacrimiformis]|uniref:Uncharacterized protein n=1 Tax=Rubripirellula lacrimiformis TaxID=1930273 RepID=A0A517NEY0_9BACT|nr:hypothetical protein [Rubripirellula lacrimiformis]QDT05690.1 hypothetical protein K227x_40930 [Rubripirellula lacrimiformis]